MKLIKKICLLTISTAFISGVPVQNKYMLAKDYTVTIKGTSNLHSWEEKVGTVAGEGMVIINEDGSYDIHSINIRMEVYSIKSDMGSVMNSNTYKALKADINPQIIFNLNAPLKSIKSKTGEKLIPVKGSLSIAGVKHMVDMQVKIAITVSGALLFEGSQTIKMTDYDIKPPTALLGTLKTGNEITINFKTSFTITK